MKENFLNQLIWIYEDDISHTYRFPTRSTVYLINKFLNIEFNKLLINSSRYQYLTYHCNLLTDEIDMEDPFGDMDLMDHLLMLREEQEFIYSKFTFMRRNLNALVKSNCIICIK